MFHHSEKLVFVAALLSVLGLANGQNGQNDSTVGTGPNAAGPTWHHSEYTTSPPVYPTREYHLVCVARE